MQQTPDAPGERPLSYAERLKQAKAAKAGGGRGPDASAAPIASAASNALPPPGSPAAGEPQFAEPESPFTPTVQEELRTAITVLAARLQREKPLSRDEFDRFEAAVAIIVEDAMPNQEIPIQQQQQQQSGGAAPQVPSARLSAPAQTTQYDDEENEGAAWDPKAKSYGLPTGTVNTYDIEGMGAMSPDEYQEALRNRVSARAKAARSSGSYG